MSVVLALSRLGGLLLFERSEFLIKTNPSRNRALYRKKSRLNLKLERDHLKIDCCRGGPYKKKIHRAPHTTPHAVLDAEGTGMHPTSSIGCYVGISQGVTVV